MLTFVYAKNYKNTIGKDNLIPWRCVEDLRHYKSICNNKDIIMGYNTYKSLLHYYKDRKMPYNKIYVCSRTINEINDLFNEVVLLRDPVNFILSNKDKDFVCAGGKMIFELLYPYCDICYESIIKNDIVGDCFLTLDFSSYKKMLIRESDEAIYYLYERI